MILNTETPNQRQEDTTCSVRSSTKVLQAAGKEARKKSTKIVQLIDEEQ